MRMYHLQAVTGPHVAYRQGSCQKLGVFSGETSAADFPRALAVWRVSALVRTVWRPLVR